MIKETQREPRVSSFEIYVYNKLTNQYSESSIGSAMGRDPAEACDQFITNTGWSPDSKDEILHAQYPICR